MESQEKGAKGPAGEGGGTGEEGCKGRGTHGRDHEVSVEDETGGQGRLDGTNSDLKGSSFGDGWTENSDNLWKLNALTKDIERT